MLITYHFTRRFFLKKSNAFILSMTHRDLHRFVKHRGPYGSKFLVSVSVHWNQIWLLGGQEYRQRFLKLIFFSLEVRLLNHIIRCLIYVKLLKFTKIRIVKSWKVFAYFLESVNLLVKNVSPFKAIHVCVQRMVNFLKKNPLVSYKNQLSAPNTLNIYIFWHYIYNVKMTGN